MRRLVLLAVPAIVLATACGNLGAPEGVTRQGQGFTTLWRVFLLLAIAVAALIWVLVAWSIIRYRRRRRPDMPSQRQYNIPLEVTYLTIPLLLVGALFAITVVATEDFTNVSDDPDVVVEVQGFQWQWQFSYPEEGIVLSGSDQAGPTLVLPVDQTVRLKLFSHDVNHSFWVPEFLEKRDLIPGVDNEIDIHLTETGEWVGRCAEYCGLDHWLMTFSVRGVTADEYDDWVTETAAQPQPVVAGAAQATSPDQTGPRGLAEESEGNQ